MLLLWLALLLPAHAKAPVVDPALAAELSKVTGVSLDVVRKAVRKGDRGAAQKLLKYVERRGLSGVAEERLNERAVALKRCAEYREGDTSCASVTGPEDSEFLELKRHASAPLPGGLAARVYAASVIYRNDAELTVIKRRSEASVRDCSTFDRKKLAVCERERKKISALRTELVELSQAAYKKLRSSSLRRR